MKRAGYIMMKDAAVQYSVSRAKLHRLVRLGRLRTTKDPLDERVTLLRTEDVEALFKFPQQETDDVVYRTAATGASDSVEGHGKVTADLAARMDAVRVRVAEGGRLSGDSVDIIRQERDRRVLEVDGAGVGDDGRQA
jgi:hypothetical protein